MFQELRFADSERKADTITYLYRCHGDHFDPHKYQGTLQTNPQTTSALHKSPPTNQMERTITKHDN